ncbi:MAG: thiamine pyrophosphate-binding protein [Planctomycetes bacterium]|nr:thiamine pyrophosphate-binding protein [Planctomycetota bacterium]
MVSNPQASPTHMTGGAAVAQSLVAHGVDTVFGIPGAHNLALYDALCDLPSVRHIVARHEQGAAFMADGYARASGKVGICLTTSGPAALNAVTSLGTAYSDSSPVFCIASQIPLDAIGLEKGFLHECHDQLGCLRPVTSWCKRAETVKAIPDLMREAFVRMQSGRPRPTALEIPCDVLDSSDDVTIPNAGEIIRPKPDAASVKRAIDVLRSARRPVIWAGGGGVSSGADKELLQLAERLQAPVFTTVLGRGAIPDDHPLAAGANVLYPPARDYVAGCDAMLAVGTRFTQEESDNWKLRLPPSLVHVEIDANEIDRNYPATVGVVGDARESLQLINDGLIDTDSSSICDDRAAELATLKKRIIEECRERAPDGVKLVETLRAALPRETIVVSDLTVAAYWCRRLLDYYEPRTNVYPWGFCTLGFGVPAAIGAKAARPDRPVVVICGDGGFLFNAQELAVAVQFDLPIIVLLFNDGAYGVLRQQQQVLYGRTNAADLANPDFVALAKAFYANAQRVTTIDALGPAISTALKSGRTTVIEAVFDVPWQAMEPSADIYAPKGAPS